MFTEFTTTITHRVEIGKEGITSVEHSADVDAGEFGGVVGARIVQQIVKTGCLGVIKAVDNGEGEVLMQVKDTE